MTIGTGATAFAQPVGNPIVPDASGSSAGTEVADDVADAATAGERVQLGENIKMDGLYEVLSEVALFKQLTSGAAVAPGEGVTMRLEAEGVQGVARVGELHSVMPAGFQIDSVVLNRPDGDSTPLTEEQYTSVERDGLRDTRVDLNNNGIGRIQIGQGSVSMDFTYIAPEETGWYQTGAGMETSLAGGTFPHSTKVDEGGPSVNVVPRPIIDIPGLPGSGSGSIDWGSLNIGDTGSSN